MLCGMEYPLLRIDHHIHGAITPWCIDKRQLAVAQRRVDQQDEVIRRLQRQPKQEEIPFAWLPKWSRPLVQLGLSRIARYLQGLTERFS